jgi:RNA polymerase sigma-70 factor (ECF subfamily)
MTTNGAVAMCPQPDDTADHESGLWRQACADDIDAYAEFVVLCERRIRAVLGRLLDDERDVEEAAQDTFVQAWRHRHTFRGGSRPFTWLYRIAVNEAGQRNRRAKRDTRPLDEQVDQSDTSASSVAEIAEARELAGALITGLRDLSFDYRAAVVLRDIEGRSNQQVADALGVSLAAAKSRLYRGRAQLRVAVERHVRSG